jgi:hypothetical protein
MNIIVDTIKAIDKSATIIGSILLGMEKSVQKSKLLAMQIPL